MVRASLIILVMVGALVVAASNSPAAMINYYKFDNNLIDTGGGSTVTNLTNSGTAVTYRADAGRAAIPGIADGNVVVMVAGAELDFPANDADIALGNDFTIEWWSYSTNWASTTTQDVLVANNYSIKLTGNHNWGAGTISVSVDAGGANSSPRYDPNVWLHNALVVRPDGTFDYYIEAGDVGQRIIGGIYTGPMGVTTALRLGYLAAGYSAGTQMDLDEMGFFTSALPYATIKADHDRGYLIPEPSAIALLCMGGAALLARYRRRKAA